MGPADDLTDPAPATTFAHLDATTVLSRGVAERGIYPAVDPLDSTSRIMDPNVIGAEHYGVARDVQKLLQDYKSLQDIIAILGMDELSEEGVKQAEVSLEVKQAHAEFDPGQTTAESLVKVINGMGTKFTASLTQRT